jgi:cyclopropane fatty-acyl-phospholipid synthase-like methyltransferase
MTKQFTLAETEVDAEQKTITITEEVTETREQRVTIAQLKEQHAQALADIERCKERANAIVDQITEIETALKLTVEEKPAKLK